MGEGRGEGRGVAEGKERGRGESGSQPPGRRRPDLAEGVFTTAVTGIYFRKLKAGGMHSAHLSPPDLRPPPRSQVL